ncbi:ABC transporter ATP-binding protein [Allofournierella massiliensis]|uniref:Energy-coupling factor transport system ATP-binding protein n=2 Tax=Allofournierella massiliensis TaxID=1650663 RepID=A0A4R1QVE0_9FIRM|nr:energy-coupling factor transporter ATPase [Fournierella massiliensis]TCL54924.1 energy-coupling factor transport system ATP-binding protein [Fournierella massiliensis]
MPVIAVENLKYRYPHADALALDGLTFTVEKGEFIGIVGANGAGKSTLSQALIGLVPQFYNGAYGGRVLIDGLPAESTPISELCCKVGLVFQNPFNQLSGAKDNVYEEVAFGMQNLGVPRAEMHRRTENALKLLDIWQFRDRNPFDLSGGQMQRVAIASILVMEPDIIVLDEPTSQLDPQGSEEVFRTVDKLAHSGITILMIEQKIEKIAAYCDRILLLHQGHQIAFDTPQKVFSRPDLEQLGVQAPVFTRICRALGTTLPDGSYPVTVEEAANQLRRTSVLPPVSAQQEERPELFEIRNLEFSYRPGTPVLHGINLQLDARPTAIIGQNGAGKTTLVKLLKGLLRPTGPSIWFRGEDISHKTVAALAAQVGYVFQNPDDQIFRYNVLDEVMFGPLNIGMSEEQAREKSRAALALTGLSDQENSNPYDLELNERKMVAIASVLAMDPDVLILDEPTIAQDMMGRRRIADIVRTLSAQGKLVLAILHDMDFVAECFDRVVVMAQGQVVADGSPRQVFADSAALQAARLDPPHVTQLCTRLGYDGVFLTVEEFLDACGCQA